jgi:hypothetical protein
LIFGIGGGEGQWILLSGGFLARSRVLEGVGFSFGSQQSGLMQEGIVAVGSGFKRFDNHFLRMYTLLFCTGINDSFPRSKVPPTGVEIEASQSGCKGL